MSKNYQMNQLENLCVAPLTVILTTVIVGVLLKVGFHAKAGSMVHAFIAPCVASMLIENDQVVARSTITLPHEIQFESIDLTIAPNPFQSQTNLNFRLPETEEASVALFDQTGRRLRYLLSPRVLDAGDYNIRLTNEELRAGMYLVVLQTATKRITKKVMLVK